MNLESRLAVHSSSGGSSMDAKSIASAIVSTRIVSYVNAGCISILFFDFFDCLEKEVRVIWMKKMNFTKIMYLLTRYTTFWEAGVVIYQLSIPGDWFESCAVAFKLNAFLFVFGLGVGEIIMTLRTYAVWGGNRILKFGLPLFYIVVWAAGFTVTAIFLTDIEFAPSPLNPYVGCYATYTNPIIFMSWVLLLFYDAVMFVLMAIPAFKAFRSGGGSRLLVVVYRDGVLYYLYLFVISLINILVTLLAPADLLLIFSLTSRVLHAILSCRVVLDIHELASSSTAQMTPLVHDRNDSVGRIQDGRVRTVYVPKNMRYV